jgi:hypothetical protein
MLAHAQMRMLLEGPLPRVSIDDNIAMCGPHAHPLDDVALVALHLAVVNARPASPAARNLDQLATAMRFSKLGL